MTIKTTVRGDDDAKEAEEQHCRTGEGEEGVPGNGRGGRRTHTHHPRTPQKMGRSGRHTRRGNGEKDLKGKIIESSPVNGSAIELTKNLTNKRIEPLPSLFHKENTNIGLTKTLINTLIEPLSRVLEKHKVT